MITWDADETARRVLISRRIVSAAKLQETPGNDDDGDDDGERGTHRA